MRDERERSNQTSLCAVVVSIQLTYGLDGINHDDDEELHDDLFPTLNQLYMSKG